MQTNLTKQFRLIKHCLRRVKKVFIYQYVPQSGRGKRKHIWTNAIVTYRYIARLISNQQLTN